jgi:upstream activation factor subunit UAF30
MASAQEVSLQSIQEFLLSLEKSVKAVQKEVHKVRQKLEDPTGEKAKARSENNSFKHPLVVSDELKAFLGLGPDELISRSEVTKRIFAYAKENSLNDGKIINIDEPLRALLRPVEGVDITVTNLQKFINHHYTKKKPVEETPAPPSTPETAAPRRGKPKVTKV